MSDAPKAPEGPSVLVVDDPFVCRAIARELGRAPEAVGLIFLNRSESVFCYGPSV